MDKKTLLQFLLPKLSRNNAPFFSLFAKQWISKDIPSYGSQSERAKIAIHWFGKYYYELFTDLTLVFHLNFKSNRQNKQTNELKRKPKKSHLRKCKVQDLIKVLCSNRSICIYWFTFGYYITLRLPNVSIKDVLACLFHIKGMQGNEKLYTSFKRILSEKCKDGKCLTSDGRSEGWDGKGIQLYSWQRC